MTKTMVFTRDKETLKWSVVCSHVLPSATLSTIISGKGSLQEANREGLRALNVSYDSLGFPQEHVVSWFEGII